MAKSLWLIISTLAVANIMAFIGIASWLGATDRLSSSRLEEVRSIFAQTVSEEKKAEQEEIAKANNVPLEERVAAGKGNPPVPSMTRNELIHEQDEMALQRLARSQREQEDLLRIVDEKERKLAQREAEFEAAKRAWTEMRARLTAEELTEQFQKTVKNYEAQKAEVARDMLNTLIEEGDMGQAVAYLNSMKPRSTAKVIDSFAQQDPALAADLLERLRTFGIETPDQEQVADDNSTQPNLAANR
ncbi:MAG: hypothetical protein RLN60_02660 [Phycisphaerales bacterium]